MPLRGETIGTAYIRILASGDGFDEDVRRELEKNKPIFEKAGGEHADAYGRGFDEETRKHPPLEDLKKRLARSKGEFHSVGQGLGSDMMKGLQEELKKAFPRGAGVGIFEGLKKDIASGKLAFEDLGTELDNLRPRWHRAVEDLRDGSRKVGSSERGLSRFAGTAERMAAGVGSVFGKGSRNDFLNFFGGFVSILPTAAAALIKFGSKIADWGSEVKRVFDEAASDAQGFGEVVRGVAVNAASGDWPALIGQLATVVAAMMGFAAIIGPIVSLVSLLTGAVLALAGSLSFALVGALVAVAGALVPLAAAFGVVVLAFAGMSKAQKKHFKAITDDFHKLQNTLAEDIFGKATKGSKKPPPGIQAIKDILDAIKPMAEAAATAVGKLLTDLGKVVKTDAFTGMMKQIGDAIGPMIGTLGDIAGHLGSFLAGAFLAAVPYINQFLGWLDKVAQGLDNISKKKGKGGLADFFKGAWDSAKIVFDLLGQIAGIIRTLFSKGKGTGDSMLQGLADAARELNKWLSDPKNAGTIQGWFNDAHKLWTELGKILGIIIQVVRKLDTPTNRGFLFAALTIAEKLIQAIGWLLDKLSDLNAWLVRTVANTISGVGDTIDQIRTNWSKLGTDIQSAWSGVTSFFSGLWSGIKQGASDAWGWIKDKANEFIGPIEQAFQMLPGDLQAAWDTVKNGVSDAIQWVEDRFLDLWNWLVGASLIPDLIFEIANWFTKLPGLIASAIGDLAMVFWNWGKGLAPAVVDIIRKVVAFFGGLASKIITKAGNLAAQFGTWVASLPGKARTIATTVVNQFVGWARKIIAKAGSIASSFASWLASLPGKARTIATQVANAFAGLARRAVAKAGSIAATVASWLSSLPGKARSIATQIANAFSSLAHRAIAKAGSITSAIASWASGVASRAAGVANDIVNAFKGLAGRIVDAIGTIVPRIRMPKIVAPVVNAVVKGLTANGGVFDGAQLRVIGEAGPEAVVPLRRPLSQVDPAVRALSAAAQGLSERGLGAGVDRSKRIDVGGITINTPTENPRAVATEVVARMAAVSYI